MMIIADPTAVYTGDTPEIDEDDGKVTNVELDRAADRVGLDPFPFMSALMSANPNDVEHLGDVLEHLSRDLRQVRAEIEGRRVLTINRSPQRVFGDRILVLDQVTPSGAELSYVSANSDRRPGDRWRHEEFQFEALGYYEVLTTWRDSMGSHLMVAEVLA